jgi:hypothetical protein
MQDTFSVRDIKVVLEILQVGLKSLLTNILPKGNHSSVCCIFFPLGNTSQTIVFSLLFDLPPGVFPSAHPPPPRPRAMTLWF